MALQILAGLDWPAARVVPNGSAHVLVDEYDEHPTTNEHSPFWPWACQVAPERGDFLDASVVIDHHHDCRACVLAMGAAAVNRPWCDVTPWMVQNMRDWYEQHRGVHGLPPLPVGVS